MSLVQFSSQLTRWCLGGLAFLCAANTQAASPWVPAGDLSARHHIEALQSQGCLDGVTLSWPISWAALMKSYRLARHSLPEADAKRCENQHAAFLEKALQQAQKSTRGVSVELGGANQEPLYTSFDTQVEDEFTSQVALYGMGERWAGQLAIGYVDGERDSQYVRLDDTYLAGIIGNWQLGVGAVDRWWGPGWQSSLALSNNARPVPGLWLSRQMPLAPESPWLSWIGPWDLQLIAGQLEQDRAIPDARLLGARFVFKPLDSLQIGLSRLAQWGGEGRPQGLDALWNAVIGRDNGETSGLDEGQDPSNQIGGLDFRLSLNPGDVPLGIYGQFMGEDEAGGLPSKLSSLAGIDMVTGWGNGSQRFFVEATDTVAGSWISDRRYGVMYEHSTYRSGFRYHGRNLASTWEGDAQAVTLGIQQFFRNDIAVALSLSQATLNEKGGTRAVVTADGDAILQAVDEQDITLAELRIGHPLLGGRLNWLLSATDEPVVTYEERERFTAGLQWTRHVNW
ncbi:capsule assembly Wzi family protein [Alcanivorax sp.]|uniref:capsule assembly Wzi family protein n=1 Tax=Alcanivorax sp. TaxID=1872427 RepID=UPI002B265EF5|nr:capsule assembly Wzi family protein [Alcanivorax sp.]